MIWEMMAAMLGKKKSWLQLLVALLVMGLLAAACGSDSDEGAEEDATSAGDGSADGDDATAEGGDPEVSEIRVGLIPIADVATVFIGIEQGFFEEEGIEVQTEFLQGGAAAIPTLVSGDIDLAFGAYPSFFSAIQEGLPLLIAVEANRPAPGFAGIYALPDSGIESPEDLAGKTVAVNTLNNVVQLAVGAQLGNGGLTLDDVELVEIPFPDQVAALEQGNVDAISVVEPFSSMAENNLEAVLVADMFAAPFDSFPLAGFYTSEDFATANPNTLAAFNRAFAEAVDYVNENEAAVPEALPTYIETATVESAMELDYPEFVSGIDTDYLQAVPDYMFETGLLDESIDAAEHVVE
jgi:NitT/TauT family transport system substrate-binding protein